MMIKLGDKLPNLTGQSQLGDFHLYDYVGNSWAIIFCSPGALQAVPSSEVSQAAHMKKEFVKRGVKVCCLVCSPISAVHVWMDDIKAISEEQPDFPVVADPDFDLSLQLGTAVPDDLGHPLPPAARTLYLAGPGGRVTFVQTYPMTSGYSFEEVLRVIDASQKVSAHRAPGPRRAPPLAAPAGWTPGRELFYLVQGGYFNVEEEELAPPATPHSAFLDGHGGGGFPPLPASPSVSAGGASAAQLRCGGFSAAAAAFSAGGEAGSGSEAASLGGGSCSSGASLGSAASSAAAARGGRVYARHKKRYSMESMVMDCVRTVPLASGKSYLQVVRDPRKLPPHFLKVKEEEEEEEGGKPSKDCDGNTVEKEGEQKEFLQQQIDGENNVSHQQHHHQANNNDEPHSTPHSIEKHEEEGHRGGEGKKKSGRKADGLTIVTSGMSNLSMAGLI